MPARRLHIITYHYVRDVARSPFSRLHSLGVEEFRKQAEFFAATFEPATPVTAMAFLRNEYAPGRDLCLLSFDDGLKEHVSTVLPVLQSCGLTGIFGVITSCAEQQTVAAVHMNHFLVARLGFSAYRNEFLELLADTRSTALESGLPGGDLAERTYPLDTPEIARFKLMFNFLLEPSRRDEIVRRVFERHLGDEREFARSLYMSWEDIRTLQEAGMGIAGHSHSHAALGTLPRHVLRADLARCRRLLRENTLPQRIWPFTYPYGKYNSYSNVVIREICELGFDCGLDTEPGANLPGSDRFRLHRIDCRGAIQALSQSASLNAEQYA